MKRNSCDYLIVGGGIAGFSMAHFFDKDNQDYLLTNVDTPGSATNVSSGLINPVTGQRLVLSWKYGELKPVL